MATMIFIGGGNADQQLRWAANSAAALLLSYVVTLQPAQVDWTFEWGVLL